VLWGARAIPRFAIVTEGVGRARRAKEKTLGLPHGAEAAAIMDPPKGGTVRRKRKKKKKKKEREKRKERNAKSNGRTFMRHAAGDKKRKKTKKRSGKTRFRGDVLQRVF